MLNGFDKQTEPLTNYERDILLPVIVNGLRKRVGVKSAISNKKIVTAMRHAKYELTEARLRKIINHIRCCGYVKCLVATSKGYFVATSPDELSDYIDSLKGREQAISTVRASMEQQYGEWLNIINQKNHHHNV